MKSCLFFFFCYLFYSCLDFEDKQLEYALNFAGDNRNELEKVLEHYASDPEKLESARFLIRNMPRYYGYELSLIHISNNSIYRSGSRALINGV